jgi:hypothetical protein
LYQQLLDVDADAVADVVANADADEDGFAEYFVVDFLHLFLAPRIAWQNLAPRLLVVV